MSFEQGTQFIWTNARLLERAVFEYRIGRAPSERIIAILKTYQNPDGGFGHALEPDLRATESQPLFTEFALRTLYDSNLHAPELVYKACDFLAHHADLQRGIPTIFPSSQKYPRAGHWDNPHPQQPSFERLTGLVGLANWQGISHPWLENAVEACVKFLTTARCEDAHTIHNAFCLLESLPDGPDIRKLYNKLSGELSRASFFCELAPVTGYGLTPLDIAPSPDSYCRTLFSDAQIEAHLNDLASKQEPDGGWPIAWQPPGELARCEWRAYKTVISLCTLRAYGRAV